MSRDFNRKTGLSSAAAVVAVAVTVAAWPLAAQAERGHGGHTGGGAGFSAAPSAGGPTRSSAGERGSSHFSGSRSFGFRANDGHRRHFRHRHNGVAFGFYGDDYGYGYTSSCEYYRQRALDTGRSYWWRRYRACLND